MATLTTFVFKEKKRDDGTWKIYIRLSHDRKSRYIPTEMFVEKKDITPSFKIKNNKVVDRCDDLIKYYRQRLYELNLEINDIPIDDVLEYITRPKSDKVGISFTDWANKWIENKAKSSYKASLNYKSALSSFSKFLGRTEIIMEDVSVSSLTDFATYLQDKPRAVSLYTTSIMKMFNDARDFYNDEDSDVIRIKHTLRKFKIPKQNVAEKRALTKEQIRAIFALPYDNRISRGLISRHDLALDCFRLSFALMGMNSADMYSCSVFEDGVIKYDRTKTKARRSDKAHIEVRVTKYIQDIFDKWRDITNERVFSFYKRYKAPEDFNRAINLGLKEIGAELGIDGLQFYSARHSMASIAVNEVGIDMWTVNLMLCHTAPSMKVTELYIKKDYSQENKAMQKVLEYVLE